ncbi:hypothetical protein [Amycolatopsis sp. NPDC051716]|jgi:hypothetical protein|uniref:hypothetical protein n=1 Tax=Amycolatopsis sp. NPDC051716 TaxID=3155804 RepID=UPI003421C6C4
MTHQRTPQRVASRQAGIPSRRTRRNGLDPFHVLEDDCSGDDTGLGPVRKPPVKE